MEEGKGGISGASNLKIKARGEPASSLLDP